MHSTSMQKKFFTNRSIPQPPFSVQDNVQTTLRLLQTGKISFLLSQLILSYFNKETRIKDGQFIFSFKIFS